MHPGASAIALRLRSPIEPRAYRGQVAAVVGHDCSDRLRRIRARALVVHGRCDRLVLVANGARLAQELQDARLLVVPQAGHFFATDEPQTDEAIRSFLEENE
jgi:pimeloyl-ACP methyl ester carboxylesterase